MPQKKKRKLRCGQIIAIIMAALVLLAAISLTVTNVFIPVKYLSAYFVKNIYDEEVGMRVSFLDVGNGDCTIVELPDGKVMLIDGGDGTYSHNLKIFKELNKRGIDKIDFLICSSVENGSCGGLADILKYKDVDKVFAPYCPVTYITSGYKSFCSEVKKLGKEITYSEYGIGVEGEAGYSFCFLSPDSRMYNGGEYGALINNPTAQNIRDASAVIWLEYDGLSFLFLGNAGQAVQKKLIEYYQSTRLEFNGRTIDITECDIVKLSDHGSTEGAYAPFLDLIKPESAIISVGKNGRGCPTLAALANAQNCVGDALYRTDEAGTVIIRVNDGSYEVSKEKK